jgi:RloB-like protein
LIICEGEIEEFYFKSFPVVTATVKAVTTRMSALQLVEYAENLGKSTDYKGFEIWCVFDYDTEQMKENQKQDYEIAINYAKKQGLRVAYSNDAFELWYVLHYKNIANGELHREIYFDFLGQQWNINYRKTGKTITFAKTVYKKLETDTKASQSEAIKRAEKLLESQQEKMYAEQNPCTTVFELVRELNKFLKK